eukprot:g4650.t1
MASLAVGADRSASSVSGAVQQPLGHARLEGGLEGAGAFKVDFPLLIVGAGPHALALLTKLMEPSLDQLEENPSNKTLFKVSNSNRISAKYKLLPDHIFTQKDATIRGKWSKAQRSQAEHKAFLENVCIVDRNKSWLAQWKHQFAALGIPNLRSALGAHCDPVDPQGMRIFIEKNWDRDSAVVNLDLDRSVAYHGPYEVPKTGVYNAFSESIVERYHLEGSITQGTVTDVKAVLRQQGTDGNAKCGTKKAHFFRVELADGAVITASNVVFATGPLNTPVYPEFYGDLDDEERTSIPPGRLLHSCNIMWAHENRQGVESFKKLLIVGGGLTAGHLAVRAMRMCSGDQHVSLVARGPLQSRQFDLDLPWMGRERTSRLATFWSKADYNQRMEVLLSAKNGGSMTPEVLKELEEGKESGLFSCFEDSDIEYAYFDDSSNLWEVQFSGDHDGPLFFDTIWCATGTKVDVRLDATFKGLEGYFNIVGDRLPKLTNDLRLHADLNAFVLGEHAGLTLGPGSVNLMGARGGAARVAEALRRAGSVPGRHPGGKD